MKESFEPMVDRHLVQRLHQARTEYLEAFFVPAGRGTGREVVAMGATRAFMSPHDRFKNKLILTGHEDEAVLDALLQGYEQRRAPCFIEINPANFNADPLSTGRRPVTDYLVQRGFTPRYFRSVWFAESRYAELDVPRDVSLQRFGPEDLEAFARKVRGVLGKPEAEAEAFVREERLRLEQDEGDHRWRHYIATLDGRPSAMATLFLARSAGYLVEGYTRAEARRQGLHGYLVGQRVNEAAMTGCRIVFSITHFDAASARNLQRHGFRLAYNFMTFAREHR
ncbi:MAG: hypothetical protein ACE5G0_02970 [Rhodothermales bacterium]